MTQGSTQGPLIAARGKHGQMFADLQTGNLCRNGFEFATNVRRCLGLHVEAVVLAESAGKKDVDTGFRRRRRGRYLIRRVETV